MTPAVVSASCHPPKAGAVLGVTNGCLLPMAPWVALGPWLGFVRGPFRLRKPLLAAHVCDVLNFSAAAGVPCRAAPYVQY